MIKFLLQFFLFLHIFLSKVNMIATITVVTTELLSNAKKHACSGKKIH